MPLADFVIRPARKEEFAAIRSLILREHLNPTGLNWRRFLVAVSARGEVLGCGQIKIHRDGSRELASIVVQKQARSRGIAQAIIQELLRQESTRPLYLMCRPGLETFYAQFSFRTISENEMPPYFRHIHLLLKALTFNRKSVLVMQLE